MQTNRFVSVKAIDESLALEREFLVG